MIPADVNVDDLASQINEDQVALESSDADLHQDLLDVVGDISTTDFGSVGIAVLDDTPAQTADLRDIAQVLLNETSVDSVIVRAPSSGAIVSDVHSRADLESAQFDFLRNPDYPEATRIFAEHVTNNPANGSLIGVLFIAFAIVAVITSLVFLAFFARRGKARTP